MILRAAAYPDLNSSPPQFLSWLPLPNIFHPNGVLNILAHTPENAAPPDLTPQLFTSWETDAATPTIQLQSLSPASLALNCSAHTDAVS